MSSPKKEFAGEVTSAAIGSAIKTRRMALGLTQEQLAARLGVHKMTVVKYESGDIELSLDRAMEVARALEWSIGHFLRVSAEAASVAEGAVDLIEFAEELEQDEIARASLPLRVRRLVVDFERDVLSMPGIDENFFDFVRHALRDSHLLELIESQQALDPEDRILVVSAYIDGLKIAAETYSKARLRQAGDARPRGAKVEPKDVPAARPSGQKVAPEKKKGA